MNPNDRLQRLSKQEETLQSRLDRLDDFNNQVSPLVRQGISDISKNTVGGQMPTEFWNRDLAFVDRRNMDRTNARQDLSEVSRLLQNAYDNEENRKIKRAELGLKYNQETGELESSGNDTDILELLKLRKELQEQNLDTTVVDLQLSGLGYDPSNDIAPGKLSIVQNIDDLLNQDISNLGSISGRLQVAADLPGFMTRGTETARTKSFYETLINQLTLENRQKLKGQGQISDKETEMLAKASSRLTNERSLDEVTLKKELQKIRAELVKGSSLEGTGQVGVGAQTSSGYIIEEIK